MVDYTERKNVRRWLDVQAADPAKRANITIFAARCALRVAPVLAQLTDDKGLISKKIGNSIILPIFSAMAAPWFAGTWPNRGAEIANAANAANAAANANAANAAANANAANAAANAARDIKALERGMTASELSRAALWPAGDGNPLEEDWNTLSTALLARSEDWEVWINWYNARLNGQPTYPHLTAKQNEEIELASVLEITEDDWEEGAAHVNAKIKEIEERFRKQDSDANNDDENGEVFLVDDRGNKLVTENGDFITVPQTEISPDQSDAANSIWKDGVLADAVEIASPDVSLDADRVLRSKPNAMYDVPVDEKSLRELVIMQRSFISTVLSDLPPNPPTGFIRAFEEYDAELVHRPNQPVLGLLKGQERIIAACIKSPKATREWLEDHQLAGYLEFRSTHLQIVEVYPRDGEKEDRLDKLPFDEDVDGQALRENAGKATKLFLGGEDEGIVDPDLSRQIQGLASAVESGADDLPPNWERDAWAVELGEDEIRTSLVSSKKRSFYSLLGAVGKSYALARVQT